MWPSPRLYDPPEALPANKEELAQAYWNPLSGPKIPYYAGNLVLDQKGNRELKSILEMVKLLHDICKCGLEEERNGNGYTYYVVKPFPEVPCDV